MEVCLERLVLLLAAVASLAMLLHVIAQSKGVNPPRLVTISIISLFSIVVVLSLMVLAGVFG